MGAWQTLEINFQEANGNATFAINVFNDGNSNKILHRMWCTPHSTTNTGWKYQKLTSTATSTTGTDPTAATNTAIHHRATHPPPYFQLLAFCLVGCFAQNLVLSISQQANEHWHCLRRTLLACVWLVPSLSVASAAAAVIVVDVDTWHRHRSHRFVLASLLFQIIITYWSEWFS